MLKKNIKRYRGKVIFSMNSLQMKIVKGVKNLNTKFVQTNRVLTSVDKKLDLEGRSVSLKGAKGTRLYGKEFIWRADQDIYLKSINRNIIFCDTEEVHLDMKRTSITVTKNNGFPTSEYKVCVCNSTGKLFRIPDDQHSKIYCDHFESLHNPCL